MKEKSTEFHFAIKPGKGDPKRILRFTMTCELDGPPTERLKRQVIEIFTRGFLRYLPREFAEKYERAYYGNLLHSEKKRRAMDFLRMWNHNLRSAKKDGQVRGGRKFLARLEPFIEALDRSDADFFQGLAKAMQILKEPRISNLDKWLFEYAIENRWIKTHTVRELNEQFVSKFRAISDEKLRDKCNKLGIPFKEGPRGKAAERYGTITGRKLK
jgi:hypothetical protein